MGCCRWRMHRRTTGFTLHSLHVLGRQIEQHGVSCQEVNAVGKVLGGHCGTGVRNQAEQRQVTQAR